MRIAYLNPHLGLAEEQAFRSLKAAADTLNIELVASLPSELRESDGFDFVISTTALLRKTTSHPTFLSAHNPRHVYVDNDAIFSNTSSFDGYLCISDSLRRFFSHLAQSLQLPVIAPGFYYNAPQQLDLQADIPAIARRGELALCYFGTNWDGRAERLFRRLAAKPYARIYGPQAAWTMLPPGAYAGSTPFDGVSVQKEYERFGVGLVCLSQEHLLDDIVSNRIFEIASAGACAICPDTPWMRDNFGDTVFYYAPFASPEDIVWRIDEVMAAIAAAPDVAAAKALEAKRIFEERFAATHMLRHAVAYFEAWKAERDRRAAPFQETRVDVVIRTGGRPLDFIARAIASIERQTAGRFRLIVVRYTPVDLQSVCEAAYGRIDAIEVVDCPEGNRSETLAAGLDRVTSPYFALLDDDDYLLDSHFQHLLETMSQSDDRHRFAYSDILQHNEGDEPEAPWYNGVTVLKEGPAWGDIHTLLQRFSPHCFIATANCLERFSRAHWQSHTAEDVLLICEVLRSATPLFSRGASCVYSVGRSDTSDFFNDPRRLEDELALVVGIGAYVQTVERKFPDAPQDARGLVYPVLRRLMEGKRERIQQHGGGQAVLGQWVEVQAGAVDIVNPALLDQAEAIFVPVSLDRSRLSGSGQLADAGPPVRVQARLPFELSLIVDIGDYALAGCTSLAVATFDGMDEPIFFGLLDDRGDLVRKTNIPTNVGRIQAAAGALDGQAMEQAALQAGSKAPRQPFRLHSLYLGYRLEELAKRFGREELRADEARALVTDWAAHQRAQAPEADLALSRVNFRHPRSIYRTVVGDGKFSEGPPRTLRTGRTPWDYFGQIYVPHEQMADARWIRLQFSDVRDSFYVLLVDSDFVALGDDRAYIRADKKTAEVWLDTRQMQGDAFVILQSNDAPSDSNLTLRAVELAR